MEHKLKVVKFVFIVFLLSNIPAVWGREVVNYMEGSMRIHNVLSLNSFAKEVRLSIEGIMNNHYQSSVLYPLSKGKVVINKSSYGEKYEFTYSSLPAGRVVLDAYGHFLSRGIREPAKGAVDRRFLEPTEHIQSANSKIKELAKEIVGDEKEEKYKVVKVVEWIRNNLKYDERYADKNYDALSILDMRRGVCAEYTTLFIAFMRSLGIAARYASGYAYNGERWERHAYAEAYVGGKWMPVDVLWEQVGFVDASHLLFSYSADNQRSDSLEIEGSKEGGEWEEDEYYFNLSHIEKVNLTHLAVSLIGGGKEGWEVGRDGALVVHIKNPYDFEYMENISVIPCLGSSLNFKIKNKIIWLRKGDNYVVFPFHVGGGLKKGYEVECPTIITSMFGENKVNGIKYYSPLNPSNYEREAWEVRGEREGDYEGTISMYISDVNGMYYVISPYSFQYVRGGEVELKPYKLGENVYYVISDNVANKGEVKEFRFLAKKYKYIKSISAPSPAFVGNGTIIISFYPYARGKRLAFIVRDEQGKEREEVKRYIDKEEISLPIKFYPRTHVEIYIYRGNEVVEKSVKEIDAWEDLVILGKQIHKNDKGMEVIYEVKSTNVYNLSAHCYDNKGEHKPVSCSLSIPSPSRIQVFIPTISPGNYTVNITYEYRGQRYVVSHIYISLFESVKLHIQKYLGEVKEFVVGLEG